MGKLVHGECRRSGRAPEYRAWDEMIKRCYNTNRRYYAAYGGRGITVCARWRHSYENFLADVGRRPSPQHSLDRKDNNGHYEPGNVRWATKQEQAQNTRNVERAKRITFGGHTRTFREWAEATGIGMTLIINRLKLGWSVEEALTTPVRGNRHV
jgi:hypothetical protein